MNQEKVKIVCNWEANGNGIWKESAIK